MHFLDETTTIIAFYAEDAETQKIAETTLLADADLSATDIFYPQHPEPSSTDLVPSCDDDATALPSPLSLDNEICVDQGSVISGPAPFTLNASPRHVDAAHFSELSHAMKVAELLQNDEFNGLDLVGKDDVQIADWPPESATADDEDLDNLDLDENGRVRLTGKQAYLLQYFRERLGNWVSNRLSCGAMNASDYVELRWMQPTGTVTSP